MVDTQNSVLVIGAGPSGLALAVVLAQYGVSFTIIDSKNGPVEESRAALVHVRTLELFKKLGISDGALSRGLEISDVNVSSKGRKIATFPLVGTSAAQVTSFSHALALEQSQTEQLLIEKLSENGIAVEWNTTLTGLFEEREHVVATVQRKGASSNTLRLRWVVGADGSQSLTRRLLGVGFRGGTFSQTGLVADVGLLPSVDGGFPENTLQLNLTAGGFVGILPLPNSYRLFGAIPTSFEKDRSGTSVSHEAYATVPKHMIQQWLDGYFDNNIRVRDVEWTGLFRIHSRIADTFRCGRVFLIGDAAHIHSPAGGQGMNLGIGDGFNLGWKLGAVCSGQTYPELLESYEAERYLVAKKVLRGSDRGFALETADSPVATLMRENIAPPIARLLLKSPIVQRCIFELFSQTWIRYLQSPNNAAKQDRQRPRHGERIHCQGLEAKICVNSASEGNSESCSEAAYTLLLLERTHKTTKTHEDIRSWFSKSYAHIHLHTILVGDASKHLGFDPGLRRIFLIRPDDHLAFAGSLDGVSNFWGYLRSTFKLR